MNGWYDDGMGWGGWVAMSLMMVLFWSLIIFAVIAIVRGASRDSGRSDQAPRPDPTQTLDERFARGEIDSEEYEARRSVLRANR